MHIRNSKLTDLPRIMQIYEYAREFMKKNGNPNQWGQSNWPPEDLILDDIKKEKSFVYVNDDDKVIGVFYYEYGKDIEPTYENIYDGNWIGDNNYAVVHRIAGDGSEKGIGAFCINWAFEKSGHIRIDTHEDNVVMQNLLKKLGFEFCGIIHLKNGDKRLAYEKIKE